MPDEVFQKGEVARHAAHAELAQRAVHAVDGFVRVASARGDFDQQRVVERRDDGAVVGGAGIKPYARARCAAVAGKPAVVGREALLRVFRRHAALQRVTGKPNVFLRGQKAVCADALALAHGNLRLHQVNVGHFLGNGVLHLNARIDFDEVERARVRVH